MNAGLGEALGDGGTEEGLSLHGGQTGRGFMLAEDVLAVSQVGSELRTRHTPPPPTTYLHSPGGMGSGDVLLDLSLSGEAHGVLPTRLTPVGTDALEVHCTQVLLEWSPAGEDKTELTHRAGKWHGMDTTHSGR